MGVKKVAPWAGTGVAICASLLMLWEGYDPVAKHQKIDPIGVITWCHGKTNYDDPTVVIGTRFTREQCKTFLEEDMPKYAAPLQRCVKGFDTMPPTRQAALVSAGYNLGSVTVCASSIVRLINAGDVRGGCDALLRFVFANGKFLQGLKNRREAERKLCLEGL